MTAARSSVLRECGVVLLAVAGATLARYAIDGLVGDLVPLSTFVIAVAAVALYGSLPAALLCTALSALVGSFLFVPPRLSLRIAEGPHLVRVGLFVLSGLVIAILANRFARARGRIAQAAAAERDRAHEIHQQRQRFQDIIQSIPGVVWEAWGEPDSGRQRINYVSDYVETMLGYRPEEWTSQPNFWLQIVPPEERAEAARRSAEIFASGNPAEHEFRWTTKDGRTIWVLAHSSVIRDEHGVPVGMRGVTFDITHRKEAERRLALLAEISTTELTPAFGELAASIARRTADVVGEYCIIRMLQGDRLEAVAFAHAIPEAMPVVERLSSYGDILSLSGLYAELVRRPRTVIENNLTEAAFTHVDRSDIEDLFERYRARRAIFTPLVIRGTLVGTLAAGRATGPPFTEADGRLFEAIAARASLALENSRLFERAQRDADEARRARAAAEEAGRIKDEFLATLSHELRTPLNAILGWAHMLRDSRLPPERHEAAIETILRNAQSQEQLIADILDVQRIMTGKIRLNVRSVDLLAVVRAAVDTVQPSAEARRVRVDLQHDDAPLVLDGDPERLQQVVWNLLSNAIKFAPERGLVQVRVSAGDGHCAVVVEDNGPGIDPSFMPHMFERFRQADSSTTRAHRGLGLGLAIVRSLVEMHGGSVAAENSRTPGKTGAVFTIRLPREASVATLAAGDGGGARDALRAHADAPTGLDGLRVLIVEDDPDGRELLVEILTRGNADVVAASSVGDALQAFAARRFDVVVSDIEMPGEDGYSLIRRIRALPATEGGDVPVAALTAYASASDRMKVLTAGFNIHMSKPVEPAELAVVVASLAGRRQTA